MSAAIVYVLIDIGVAIIMFFMGWRFYRSEGKAVRFLSGYNLRGDDERKTQMVEIEMCRNYGMRMMLMAAPFAPAAIIDFFYPGIGSSMAWGIYVIMLILLIVKRTRMEKND